MGRNNRDYNRAIELNNQDEDFERMQESRTEQEIDNPDDTPELDQCFGSEMFDIGDYE